MNGHSGYWDPLPASRAAADAPVPEAVPNLVPALPHPETYLMGRWEERNRRNVPGPFYGADTDNCWSGRMAAPDHVLYDDVTGQEFVYRQPKNAFEVDRLLFAAWADPLSGYGWDGDQHWTADSVRSWWHERSRLREWATSLNTAWSAHSDESHREATAGLNDLLTYLDGALATDLRVYLYRLQERRSPDPTEALPRL
ncbi:ferredoxin [Streptomyces sp. NBC_00659]|uniref:ferredoxin n=1 Tax=Streptomyces sp. NBC_00659 TaxID=2903669 RepID=UPI002E36A4B7|nr:ferredoxin [Streptomyces sp. NBC_00659]